jgi:hypothetical protein
MRLLDRKLFRNLGSHPSKLPKVRDIDAGHRRWRKSIKAQARVNRVRISDGVAAKIINVYLKSRLVCGGYHNHPRVRALHPPVDSVLLDALRCIDSDIQDCVDKLGRPAWSKFTSAQYETMINALRLYARKSGNGFWAIEEHWRP